MDMSRIRALCVCVLIVLSTACTSGEGDQPTVDNQPLETTRPDGPLLCEFLPEDSVKRVLGREDVSGRGYLHRRTGESATTGECTVPADAALDPALKVMVLKAHSPEGEEVLRVIAEDNPDFLFPDDIGPGYGNVRKPFERANGDEGRGGAITNSLWGNSIIRVIINDQAEGRDAMADAVALSQQIAAVLELADEPSSPYPTPQ